MDKFVLAQMINQSSEVDKVECITALCRGKKVLDLGCVRHSAAFALSDPNWLHAKISTVAKSVLGVDYLQDDVAALRAKGYDVIYGDVTKRLPIDETYDVIVAGDLIEHLTNCEGFFENLSRLLNKNGTIIISTPNPFYTDLFHFVAFRRMALINPEHVCWIDPQALSQLAHRFGFCIKEFHFIRQSWWLSNFICETRDNYYDILKGDWTSKKYFHKLLVIGVSKFLFLLYIPYKILTLTNTKAVKYSDYIAIISRTGDDCAHT